MRLCRAALLAAAVALTAPLPGLAQDNAALAGAEAPVSANATASPAREAESQGGEVLRADRAAETARPREALIRALMVLSSAGGGRPFPLVPR